MVSVYALICAATVAQSDCGIENRHSRLVIKAPDVVCLAPTAILRRRRIGKGIPRKRIESGGGVFLRAGRQGRWFPFMR